MKIDPVKPTRVYDSYWRFAVERQNTLLRRLRGDGPPYSDDPIISGYRFTNAYRILDRVSQFLVSTVIGDKTWSPEDLFFRVILYKTFNKIETWLMLEKSLGEATWGNFDIDRYDRLLNKSMAAGESIFSGAYIMPSRAGKLQSKRKHRNHLRVLSNMMKDDVPQKVAVASSLRNVFEILISYPLIGQFLAFQYAIDLNYSDLIDFSEMDFVVAGPGALDGMRKCFSDTGGLNSVELIKMVTERQVYEFERLGLNFRFLPGRPLQLIDCQNLFCEIDKYARVAHPTFVGQSGRTRLKRRYKPSAETLEIGLPRKWGLEFSLEKML